MWKWEDIRKFGLEYSDLPTMISNVGALLRFLTLNIDRRNKKGIPMTFYITTIMSIVIYYYVFLFSMTWFVFVREPDDEEVLCTIIVLSLGLSSENGVTKLIFMLLYQKSVRDIVDSYLACDALVVPGSRFAINLTKHLRVVKRRAMIFWAVIMMNGVLYVLLAVIKPGRHLMEDCFVFYGLEPIFESPNFEIAFFANAVGTWVTCYFPANITGFFILVTGYSEAQMIALTEEVRLLWNDAQLNCNANVEVGFEAGYRVAVEDEVKTKITNEYVKKYLVNIVKNHTTNINMFHQVKKVFRVIVAAEFILIILAIIAELLGGLEKTFIQLPYALMFMGMDCLVGQRLTDASAAFVEAVYDCKWENFDHSNRKIVLLMMQNGQRSLSLSAGDVTTLNYSCFMSVIRMIYQAFTALRSSTV